MRLRFIKTVSFSKSERTNFDELPADTKGSLRGEDVVCFVSMTGDQLVFVHGFSETKDKRRVIHSERLRLDKGTWEPLMLANYAERAGIQLEGLKRFEEHYARLTEKEQRKAKRKG